MSWRWSLRSNNDRISDGSTPTTENGGVEASSSQHNIHRATIKRSKVAFPPLLFSFAVKLVNMPAARLDSSLESVLGFELIHLLHVRRLRLLGAHVLDLLPRIVLVLFL